MKTPPTAPGGGLTIGPLRLASPFLLAPMAGYTEAPFRALCLAHACGLVFTELTSVDGLVLGSSRTWSYLEPQRDEQPTAAHIYGSDPNLVARAVERITATQRFALVDINCGCPMPKVTRRGAGAALMEDPSRIASLVRAARSATGLPVTIKTRLGLTPGEINIVDVASAAADAGAAAIFVHARVASARHVGPADWSHLAEVRRRAGIPVIGNGGVRTAAQALRSLDLGVDGVMIGRAAIGNPWIFSEAAARLRGITPLPPTREERRAAIARHLRGLIEQAIADEERRRRRRGPDERAVAAACRRFRRHLVRYLTLADHLFPRPVRRRILFLETEAELLAAVDEVLLASPSSPDQSLPDSDPADIIDSSGRGAAW